MTDPNEYTNLKYEIRGGPHLYRIWDKEHQFPAKYASNITEAQSWAVAFELADLVDWVLGLDASQDAMQDCMEEIAMAHLNYVMSEDLEQYDKAMDAVGSYLPKALRYLANKYEMEAKEFKLRSEIHRMEVVPKEES